MKVADNHFAGDFFGLNPENSGFEIASKFSYKDRELSFDELTFTIFGIVSSWNHFFSIDTTNTHIVPEPERNNRIVMQVFPDKPVKIIGVITSVHDIAIRRPELVTLFGEFHDMAGIMDLTVRSDESGMTWRSVSTEIDVSRNCFRSFPDRSEK